MHSRFNTKNNNIFIESNMPAAAAAGPGLPGGWRDAPLAAGGERHALTGGGARRRTRGAAHTQHQGVWSWLCFVCFALGKRAIVLDA